MNRKSKGFTLLELIIAMAISAIAMTLIMSIFMTGIKIFANSDVKTDLQMETKDIQEKLSNIGMQAIKIENITGNASSGEISSITILSYDQNGVEVPFEIKAEESKEKYKDNEDIYKIYINGNEISSNVKSFKINNRDIIPIDNNKSAYSNADFIKFDIILKKENVFTSFEQPVNFTVTFRNKK